MSITVSVTDFGPIGRGEVRLRPLTVFVGPSNSGKSYFATLLYALLQTATLSPEFRPYRAYRRGVFAFGDWSPPSIAEGTLRGFAEWAREKFVGRSRTSGISFTELPDDVR